MHRGACWNIFYSKFLYQKAFVYDCRNRLIQAGNTSYEYDAENNRIGMAKHKGSENETSLTYVVDSASGEYSQVLISVETDKSGNRKKLYYYYGANLLVAQEEYKVSNNEEQESTNLAVEGSYLLYHFNNVGSTTAVTNADGTIKYQYQYSPYGELIEGSYGEVAFLYNGQYGVASDDNGLYYMRARYYNIDIRRFVNQDVLTGSIERSSSLNRYAYVEGNPVSYLDPFELEKYDTSKIRQVVTIIKLVCQSVSFVFLCTGQLVLSKIFGTIAEIFAISSIALYVVDYTQAKTQKEKNVAIENISFGVVSYIFGKILSFIGKSPGLDGNLEETISQKAMEIATAGTDLFISVLTAFLEE